MDKEEYIKKMTSLRGEIISSQIQIESLIDRILVSYYSNNIKEKKNILFVDLISNLNFQKKIQLVVKIVPNEFKDKDFKKNLNFIREKRNVVAHYQWTQITEEQISLSNGRSSHEISDGELEIFKRIVKQVRISLDKTIFKEDDVFNDELKEVITIPTYNPEKGFNFKWEDGFVISAQFEEAVHIKANNEGLKSLANHFLNMSQTNIPTGYHIHLDENNSLEKGSVELIIEKSN